MWPVPIPADRVAVYRSYGLEFDETGCPMSTKGGKLTFHPLIPAYLIADFVNEFGRTGDEACLGHARSFADHAVRRAVAVDGALVWPYDQGEAASTFAHSYYSGLTQAWYLKSLSMLAEHTAGLDETIAGVFRALQIPAESDGVLVKRDFGLVLEEYPHRPPLFTLNGWLTAVKMVIGARARLDALGLDYASFVDRNLDGVEHLLPLFDAEFCLNSRYQLTGFTRARLEFDTGIELVVKELAVAIPGEGRFPGVVDQPERYRWQSHVERNEPGIVQANVVLSLASHPKPNRLELSVEAPRDCEAAVLVSDGDYRPDITAAPTERWRPVETVVLTAGANSLDVELPWDDRNLFAYPTNFKKTLGDGTYFNSYHFIHVLGLAGLYSDWDRRPLLKEWALRWLDYTDRWNELAVLKDGPYLLESHRYGAGFRPLIESMLEAEG